jgi:hypothetical protein
MNEHEAQLLVVTDRRASERRAAERRSAERRGGRPRLSEGERLDELLMVRFKGEELERLFRLAKRRGLHLSTILRKLALRLLKDDEQATADT